MGYFTRRVERTYRKVDNRLASGEKWATRAAVAGSLTTAGSFIGRFIEMNADPTQTQFFELGGDSVLDELGALSALVAIVATIHMVGLKTVRDDVDERWRLRHWVAQGRDDRAYKKKLIGS